MKLSKNRQAFGYFSPRLIGMTLPQVIGAIADQQFLAQALSQLANNGQSTNGGVNFTSSASAALTLTALANAVQLLTNGGAVVVTLDAAYNVVASLPTPRAVGDKFAFQIAATGATTVATPTLLATDVTLSGTTSVLAAAMRWFQGVITQLNTTVAAAFTSGTTFTSLTQVGASNLFTVVLGTNAIVPVVGTLMQLVVTTGTLLSGWYPIVKVNSATSIVIATPAGTVWTATAATVNTTSGTGAAPSTFAPLVTITGLFATATAVIIV